tara:strand:- start:5292 stop:5708 length:417 start_codon:yes stop_codon:yes gene_type:complete
MSFYDLDADGLELNTTELLKPGLHKVKIQSAVWDDGNQMLKFRMSNEQGVAFVNMRFDKSSPKQRDFNRKRMLMIATALEHPTPSKFASEGVEWYEGKELLVTLKANDYSQYPEMANVTAVKRETAPAVEQIDDDIPF